MPRDTQIEKTVIVEGVEFTDRGADAPLTGEPLLKFHFSTSKILPAV